MNKDFVHLHVHSHYSLLDGLPKIPELINYAKALGYHSLALTDHGNLYGAIEFYKTAKRAGIKPIIGVEAYITPESRLLKRDRRDAENYHITILAKNNEGYKNLLKLISSAYLEGFYYRPRIDKEILRKYSSGLIGLSGCPSNEIARTILANHFDKARDLALEYQDIFGPENFYLEIYHHPNVAESVKVKRGIIELSKVTGIPLVATHDVHYLRPEDAHAEDILLAIQTGNKLTDANRLTLKDEDFSLQSKETMWNFFKDIPEALENTVKIAEQCNLEIPLGIYTLPHFPLPEAETPNSYLEKLSREGLKGRFGFSYEEVKSEDQKKIIERLNYELSVIEKTGFAPYFLIVHDVISHAIKNGISFNTRGSAGGSLISYLLHITAVDPIKYGLYFERFLNPERISMPDIDVDFSDVRRDEILNYTSQRYGNDKVAQIITFGTMAARAAIRDVGRVMDQPYMFCDKLAKLIPMNLTLKEALETVPDLKEIYNEDPRAKEIIDAAMQLEGVVRHASVHACGIVITPQPLTEYVPLQRAPQDETRIITQYEMGAIEDLGLLKMDFLGLRNLTTIEETKKLLKKLRGRDIDTSNLPLDDKKIFELLKKGDTVGVFQLESHGMRRYLKELKPTELEDIIAMISLYRPGPVELIPSYIKRKFGKEKVTYLHPKLESILSKTYGIMIYQEQLMEMAKAIVGFTLAEADTLRKAVGKKIKSLLQEQKDKFFNGAQKNNIGKETAQKLWGLVEPFDRYGFNRSHAASYAMISYQTAYLKTHYPLEFFAALFNTEGFDVERIKELKEETKNHGIEILPPDINKSGDLFRVEGSNIRFGLAAIKNVGEKIAQLIAQEREKNGNFKTLEDFLLRVQSRDLNKKSLESLIKAGAFDSMEDRYKLFENIEELLFFISDGKRRQNALQTNLFSAHGTVAALKLRTPQISGKNEKLAWEKELLGFYFSGHPLQTMREKIQRLAMPIKNLGEHTMGRSVKIAGVLSNVKRILTRNGALMLSSKLEDLSDEIDVIVFPRAFEQFSGVFQEGKIVLLQGRVDTRDERRQFICENAVELE